MHQRWMKWLGWGLGTLLIGLGIWKWPMVGPFCSSSVSKAANLLARTGRWGPLLVAFVPTLPAFISPLPVWPMTVAGGALYGVIPATLLSLVGAATSAAINFVLARKLGVRLVKRFLGPKWIQAADKLRPLHFVGLSLVGRLMPIACSDLVAYAAGIGNISMPTFLGMAVLGQAPALFVYAFLGHDLVAARGASVMGTVVILLLVALALSGRRIWQRMVS